MFMQRISLLAGMFFSVSLLNTQNLSRTFTTNQSFVSNRAVYTDNADTVRADAVITHATVYFGYGAELTHDARVKISGTTRFIVISQLSTAVDINSLQISCPE